MKFVNLTPHVINVLDAQGVEHALPSEGSARVAQLPSGPKEEVAGFAIADAPQFGAVEGLPAPSLDTMFVVSMLVASRVGGRRDVVSPDTGPTAIREGGQIKAVRGFVRAP